MRGFTVGLLHGPIAIKLIVTGLLLIIHWHRVTFGIHVIFVKYMRV